MVHKFSRQELSARRQIKEKGFAAKLEKPGAETGANKARPTKGAAPKYDVWMIFTRNAKTEAERDAIRRGDIIALMSTEGLDGVAVEPNDFLIADDGLATERRFRVVNPNPVSPADVPLLYKVIASQ